MREKISNKRRSVFIFLLSVTLYLFIATRRFHPVFTIPWQYFFIFVKFMIKYLRANYSGKSEYIDSVWNAFQIKIKILE